MYSPRTRLYAVITESAPASTTALKCGRYTSCSAWSSTETSTSKRSSSIELSAKCFTHAITFARRPRVIADPIRPVSTGSSP